MKATSVVGLPVCTLAHHNGIAKAPEKLRKAGIINVLPGSVMDEGDVAFRQIDRDSLEGGMKNFAHFRETTSQVYSYLRELQTERVFLIGGECSLVVGGLAGLGEVFKGKPGMLWMDAHGDFNTPESSPSSYIGGMCLAMACGRGPKFSDEIETRRPLLEEERLVHLGARALDSPEVTAFESSPAKLFEMDAVRKKGVKGVATEAAKLLADRSDWIVCHLDVDVVDPDQVIAVNFPTPGGFTTQEAATVIGILNKTGKLVAVDIAAYNPSLDYDGSSAAAVVNILKESLH